MYIGVLNDPASGIQGSCKYYRRGTTTLLMPDLYGPEPASVSAGEQPNRNQEDRTWQYCSIQPEQSIGWSWSLLMDVGVDICFSLEKSCYIGAVYLALADRGSVQVVEILCGPADNLKLCGRHDARTGQTCSGSVSVAVGVTADRIVVRLRPLLTDVVLTRLDLIGAITDGELLIYPTPAQTCYSGGILPIDSLAVIVRQDESGDTAYAAKYLQESLIEHFDLHLPIISPTDAQKSDPAAIALRIDCSGQGEQYAVEVTETAVMLSGSNRISLLYAIETFAQLAHSDSGKIPLGKVIDQPYKPVRGFHFGLPPRESIVFYQRLLRHVLLPLRYNTLFIEFAGGMRFDRHPEISAAWLRANQEAKAGRLPAFPHGEMVAGGGLLEKEEVRELVDYARTLGFEVIPEVQSLSHVQYITFAHPEIAEIEEKQPLAEQSDTRAADQPPSTFYAHSYCPSNERSYEIIFDLIDEIVEVVQPTRYVHMGHDEIYQMSLCPLCIDKDPADLYVRHVTRLYDYLGKKGLGMMIWSDMLHATGRYKTHPAINRLPGDIVMLDFIWYFHLDQDLEDRLLAHGYSTIMGNLYSSHYPRYENRAAKPGMIGGEVSSWCRFDEYTLAKKGKLFDLMYSAEMLWSDRYLADARIVYTEIIQQRIPAIRDALRGFAKMKKQDMTYRPIILPPAQQPGLPGDMRQWLKNEKALDQVGFADGSAFHPADAFNLSGARRLTTRPLDVSVHEHFDRLVFLHATADNAVRIAWEPLTEVGVYTVKYSDGTAIEIPVEYAGNIWHWSKRYATPMLHPYYRHQGYQATYMADPVIQAKTENGSDLLMLGYEWINPHPERELATISCRSYDSVGADILLLGISGLITR
ncbi:MAG: family 20 glycosylhydrolase [Bacillota bacterium]|nr:family 20 glycosylhydrolase [Bacillota bacterium]